MNDNQETRPFLSLESTHNNDINSLSSLVSQTNTPESNVQVLPVIEEGNTIDDSKVKCLKTKKARIILAIFITFCFVGLFIALITLYYKWQRTDVKFKDPGIKYKDGIYGKVRIRNIDINSKAATVFINFGIGNELKQKLKDNPLRFSFDKQQEIEYYGNDTFRYDFETSKGNFKFQDGSSSFYPFDKYRYTLKSNAQLSNEEMVPVYYYLDSSILLFRARVAKKNNVAYLSIQRSATTIIITMLAMFILWGFAISYTLLALKIIVYRREFKLPDFNLGLSILFNVNSIRNMMPAAPKIGVLVDIISVLWCLALVCIAAVGVITAGWIRDMYKPPVVDISRANSPDDHHQTAFPSPEVLSIDANEILHEQNMEDERSPFLTRVLELDTRFESEIQSSLNRDSAVFNSHSTALSHNSEIVNNYTLDNFEFENNLKLEMDDKALNRSSLGTSLDIVYQDSLLGTKLENVLSETKIQRDLEDDIMSNNVLS